MKTTKEFFKAIIAEANENGKDSAYALLEKAPTFGDAPEDTLGVWGWDDTHAIAGECMDDLCLVDKKTGELVARTAQSHPDNKWIVVWL